MGYGFYGLTWIGLVIETQGPSESYSDCILIPMLYIYILSIQSPYDISMPGKLLFNGNTFTFNIKSPFPTILRILELFTMVTPNAANRQQVKLDAWWVKKFCVLVKRKCAQGQVARSKHFRKLMAALTGEDWSKPTAPFAIECKNKSSWISMIEFWWFQVSSL